MIIAIASDHSGFEIKNKIIERFNSAGLIFIDYGAHNSEASDYPDFAKAVSEEIVDKSSDRGILICGTGIGMSICANRNAGVRAALCTSEYMAKKAREHNDANILVLGAKISSEEEIFKMIEIFLSEEFEGGRHFARLSKFS